MPYVDQEIRHYLQPWLEKMPTEELGVGALNYIITRIIIQYIQALGGLNYARISEVKGALGCVWSEFYRRKAAPYEEAKRIQNGDVYGDLR